MPLPSSTRIGRVTLRIADLDRSLQFYVGVLGFREIDRRHTTEGRTARLGASGSDTIWLELREVPGVQRIPRGGLIGLYHFAVLLPARADLGRFLVHAVNVGSAISSADHLVSEALYLTDPDGLTVEVYRDRPRSEWEANGGEITMATLPLDADGVAAAIDPGTRWHGTPAGTTMGHMHFYVGALDEADAFYHGALGFDRVMWSYPGALFVSAGGYHHHVGLNTWAAHTRVAGEADAGLVSWQLLVPADGTLQAIADRLDAGGYAVTRSDTGLLADDAWGIRVEVGLLPATTEPSGPTAPE